MPALRPPASLQSTASVGQCSPAAERDPPLGRHSFGQTLFSKGRVRETRDPLEAGDFREDRWLC